MPGMTEDMVKLELENEEMYTLLLRAQRVLQESKHQMVAMDDYFEPDRIEYTRMDEIVDEIEKFIKENGND